MSCLEIIPFVDKNINELKFLQHLHVRHTPKNQGTHKQHVNLLKVISYAKSIFHNISFGHPEGQVTTMPYPSWG